MLKAPISLNNFINHSDIVVVHVWDHPMIKALLSQPLPPCRMIFWCHNNYYVPNNIISCPDIFIDTSPVQGHGKFIWSTGNMDRYLRLEKVDHEGFNVGYVGWVDYKKMHKNFIPMCNYIAELIPDVHFTIIGENKIGAVSDDRFTFTGQVDDIAPYLAKMDVFGYPLCPDHFGTCEQVLGEAMASGIVPVVMNNMAERWIVMGDWDGIRVKGEDQYVREIERMYKNPKLRGLLSKNAREVARNRYSIDSMVDKWEVVFEDIMKEPKRERMPL
jgi:glycosyltransferase involved in cell wall biosynthesis